MDVFRTSFLMVLSCAVMSVQADVDKHFFKKRTMGPHL